MKILHIPFCFYPDPVGGTEIYVAGLAREQRLEGHDVLVCAPASHNASYFHESFKVRRFAISARPVQQSDLYDAGDVSAANRFGEILDEEQPDVVHLHAFTRGASLRLVTEAKCRGISTVFSYHTPTASCMRGTLLRNGAEACSGLLDVRTCASCNLQSLGVPSPVSALLGRVSPALSYALSGIAPAGKVATALRMTELTNLRHSTFCALMRQVDRVIALCRWTQELLLLNGVAPQKISVSRQGLSSDLMRVTVPRKAHSNLRIVFLGRLSPEKGLSILIEALRTIPTVNVALDVFGVSQKTSSSTQHSVTVTDRRITFNAPLTRQELLGVLQTYDVVAVPSQWLETGPMVVMEAFAAGVPVIGSRLGGIAELVFHNVNGLLIEPKSVPDWAAAISALATDRTVLPRLRAGIGKQRTMREAASEIDEIYSQVVPRRLAAMSVVG